MPAEFARPESWSTRVDVHVHSKYSDRPSEWILRRIGAPESFVEPLHIYQRARERGMRFVTISDHNRIAGALEIAHLPGTFLSSEITTYFPEDQCKMHVLVSGVTEGQFERINELRENIYDFRQYLLEQDIVYSVAHPFYRVNDMLSIDQVEKLLLLFNRFEGINGTRDPRASRLVNLIFRNLTREMLEDMANRHNIEPVGEVPWKKTFTGGSDDHSGVYIASAYTVTPEAATVAEFLDHMRHGHHEMGGTSGTSLLLAHSFYHIAYDYYRSRLLSGSSTKRNFIDELFRRVVAGQKSAPPTLKEKIWYVANRITGRGAGMRDSERELVQEISSLLEQGQNNSPELLNDQHCFQTACRISHLVTYSFAKKFAKYAGEGRLIDSLQTVSSLGPVALSIAPYLAAFRTQHKDEPFLQDVAGYFEVARKHVAKSDRKAWITDTFSDVNGVALMIQSLATVAQQRGKPLEVITCLEEPPEVSINLRNFKPVGTFGLPEYEVQKLCFPPFLEIIEHLEREQVSELIVSTPGPLGLAALAAGRLLGLKLTGIYHTDFPLFVRFITQDSTLEQLTWRYMLWFYDQMETIYVPSEYYRRNLMENGFSGAKLQVLKRGVDIRRFHPGRRKPQLLAKYGAREEFTFLYVGRISKEKNLETMLDAFGELSDAGLAANMLVVGDGPHLAELKQRYRRDDVRFTGYLGGDDLADVYASGDVFIFPSTTDTFGNAVLEAQASGLPSIVSNKGGPPEIVEHEVSGLVVDTSLPGALRDAMARLAHDHELRTTMGRRAVADARMSSWEQVLDDLWHHRSRPSRAARQPALPVEADMSRSLVAS